MESFLSMLTILVEEVPENLLRVGGEWTWAPVTGETDTLQGSPTNEYSSDEENE
jgi:hypothetical protein